MIGFPLGVELSEHEKRDYQIYQLIAMVIEECKHKWHMSGYDVYMKLKKFGAIEYISNGYNCLHTQSIDYIITDIEEIICEGL